MKHSIIACSLLLLLEFFFGCNPSQKSTGKLNEKAEKPNVIFILADDQSYSAIHALGNSVIKTPNLDKLVNRGVTFTHTYNMGSWVGAVCMASRTMLMTGRFVWRAEKCPQQELANQGGMWSQLMHKNGYETYMTGKWHGIQVDAEKLFDHVVHVRPGNPTDAYNKEELLAKLKGLKKDPNSIVPIGYNDVMPIGYNRPLSPADTTWQPWDKKFGGHWEGGKHWSEVLGDDAITFLDSAKNHDNPFFMYLAFNAAHYPRQSPKEFVDMYPIENILLPESYMPVYPYRGDSIDQYFGQRDLSLAPIPRTEYAIKVHRQEYYAIITHMDQQIGRILDALEKSGKADNTYIFFTADNGVAIGNHGLMGKQNMYDHSMRVPLLVVGPDVPKNKKIDADVYLQDIMASTLELAGIEKPEYVEFNSLMPFIRGERVESFYPSIYGAFKTHHRMIRENGIKLIVYPRIKVMRLYDLNSDPYELKDLGGDPNYAETKINLYKKLLKLQEQMDDTLDLAAYFPGIKVQN